MDHIGDLYLQPFHQDQRQILHLDVAISLPRIPGPEPEESSNKPATPGAVNPVADVPTAQTSESAAAQSQAQPSAPEVPSDAETLALPGVPGADENRPPPSPVEEEPPSATV